MKIIIKVEEEFGDEQTATGFTFSDEDWDNPNYIQLRISGEEREYCIPVEEMTRLFNMLDKKRIDKLKELD